MDETINISPDPFRTGKAYAVADAARLADTSPQNVRRWMRGYSAPGHKMEPVFGNKDRLGPLAISFLELAEIVIVAGFRKQRVPLQRIRDAHEYARETFQLQYPFASLNLREHGGHILHQFEEKSPGPGRLVVLDLRGQFALPESVETNIVNFDFGEDRQAIRWFPFGRNIPVIVDPHLAAGTPTVRGTRVAVTTVKQRWKAGEPIQSIANDLELDRNDLEVILQRAA